MLVLLYISGRLDESFYSGKVGRLARDIEISTAAARWSARCHGLVGTTTYECSLPWRSRYVKPLSVAQTGSFADAIAVVSGLRRAPPS